MKLLLMLKRNSLSLLFVSLLFSSVSATQSFGQNDDEQDESAARISEINLNGADAVSEKEIKENIATEFPSLKPWAKDPEFDEYTLKQDIIRIERLYGNYGYYDASAEYKLEYDEEGKRVEITINIDEGEPVVLTDLNVDINGDLDEETEQRIFDSIPLEVKETFSARKYQSSKGTITDILADSGYPKSRVEGEALVNRETKSVEANFTVNPGSLYRFDSTTVEGNRDVETYVITREITYEAGEIYSTTQLNETRARIFQLDLFSSVVIDINFNDAEKTADTVIRVKERKLGTLKVGAGYGTEDLFRGQITLIQRNIFGGGRRFETSGKFSFLTQRLEALFTQPYILGGGSELIGSLNLGRDDFPSFTNESVLGSTGIRKRFAEIYSVFGFFNVQAAQLGDLSDATRAFINDDSFFLTFFNTGVERNTVDNPLNPSRGALAAIGLESSFGALGSDVDYLLGTTDLRGYKKLFGVVFASRLTLGVIKPYGDTGTRDVPIFKRFLSGGSTTHRGFPFQKLGPLDDNEDPVGGNSLILGSFEGRFPIYKNFGGVLFFDYGNVYFEELDYRLDELKYAVGAGIRYNTLVGPLRVDLGYALNPEPEFSRLQFFLSIGQAF